MTSSRPNGQRASSVPAMRRCAIYTRKSTSAGLEQEFNSLDAQREACEGYIRSQSHAGWRQLPQHYDDGGFTGANLDRPAFQQLLADIDAGRIDIVVVYKVDRLSRSLLDFAGVMGQFNQRGVAFVSVTQNFSTADAMGRLTLNMLMSFAEFEREMISERTRDKIAASRRRGMWTGGPLPYGFSVKDKKLIVNALEAIVVREAFDAYLATRSLLGVIRTLTEKGRAPRPGTARQAGWRKDHVLRMLRNPLYAALMASGGELHPAEHEALVERETWDRVQGLLDGRRDPKRPDARRRAPEYLLVGLLRCASCRAAMTPASANAHGKAYRYYRCVTRDKKGRDACPSRPLPADAIERFVIDRIREATTGAAGQALASDVVQALRAKVDLERQGLEIERRGLPGRIASAKADGGRLVKSLQKTRNAAARTAIEERIGRAADEQAALEVRLCEVDRELAGMAQLTVETEWVARALRDFDSVWDDMTPENRVRLVRAVVDRVEVDDETGTIEARLVTLWSGDKVRTASRAGVAA